MTPQEPSGSVPASASSPRPATPLRWQAGAWGIIYGPGEIPNISTGTGEAPVVASGFNSWADEEYAVHAANTLPQVERERDERQAMVDVLWEEMRAAKTRIRELEEGMKDLLEWAHENGDDEEEAVMTATALLEGKSGD